MEAKRFSTRSTNNSTNPKVVFFSPVSLSSPWPHFNCLLKWTMAWHFCKLLPSHSLSRCPPPPSRFAASLPDSHTRLILSLGSYKLCSRGEFSERRGLHSLSPLCALPGKPFQRTHGGGGGGSVTVEKENGKDMGRLEMEGDEFECTPRPPYPIVNIGTSCIWFLFWLLCCFPGA